MPDNDCLSNEFEMCDTVYSFGNDNTQTSCLPLINDAKISDLVEDFKVDNLTEVSETTITLDDSIDTSMEENDSDESDSITSFSEDDENKQTIQNNKSSYEEFAKNLIIVDRKVELGSPSFTINTKTGSMIITAKAKEDIEKIQNQFYSTRNRLKEQNSEITPEAFNFFYESDRKIQDEVDSLKEAKTIQDEEDSLSESESNSNITVTITREMINESLANLQLMKIPLPDKNKVSLIFFLQHRKYRFYFNGSLF